MTRAPPKKNKKTLDKQQTICYNKQCKGQAPNKNTERGALFMEKKFIKKDYFTLFIDLLTKDEITFPEGMTAAMAVDFCKAQIALLDKRSTAERKPTQSQKENEGFKARILEYMAAADSPLTVKAIWKGIPELEKLSNQRVTHLLLALCNAGKLEQTKGKPCRYSLK